MKEGRISMCHIVLIDYYETLCKEFQFENKIISTMSIPNHIYLISNASTTTNPNNSLTQFKNSLPDSIDFENDANIQVSLEAIGFSCEFRNLNVPEDPTFPSFIVTDCGLNTESNCLRQRGIWENVEDFRKCISTYVFDYDRLGNSLCLKKEYFLEDKWYTKEDVEQMCQNYNKDGTVQFEYEDGALTIKRNENKIYWVLLHPTFMEAFNIPFDTCLKKSDRFRFRVENSKFPNAWPVYKRIYERSVNYRGEYYFGFQLAVDTIEIKGLKFDISEPKKPEIIKVRSSIISSQILNNTHSKDLLCFCPDFKNTGTYYFKEFEQLQRIKLANTTLQDIDISLRDENDKKLQLLPGVPTYVKLKFDNVPIYNRSFNVRLTSNASEMFPKNRRQAFKVQLPNSLFFSSRRNWKVALTSISHPNLFNTFHGTDQERTLVYKNLEGVPIAKLTFENRIYTKEEIFTLLRDTFKKPSSQPPNWDPDDYIHVNLNDAGKLTLQLMGVGRYDFSNLVLNVLGYETYNEYIEFSSYYVQHSPGDQESIIINFDDGINVNYWQPDYLICYCNIVQPTVFGDEYRNILRTIPIPKENNDAYIIQEFKNKNYLPLSNTEMSEIEINLRSHDGKPIDFNGNENVIMNLEFANAS